MNNHVRALIFVACVARPAFGQPCPLGPGDASTEVRTLEGKLIFYDSIQPWFELRLNQPQCGQSFVELMSSDERKVPLDVLRGCRVRSTGALIDAMLHMNQVVQAIEPIGACVRKSPFPDYSKLKPDKAILEYRVDMQIDYGSERPPIFTISNAGKQLRPWQVYANYGLTGGGILYGYCAEGFHADKVFGAPEANPTNLYP